MDEITIIVKQLDRVESKIDIIHDRLSNIEKLDGIQNEQLATHIKRTALLEKKFIPIEKHVQLINSLTKILLTGLTLLAAYLKFLS